MPVGIHAESESLIGLGVVSSQLTIIMAQQCGAMRSSDMQTHVGRIATVEAMTVNTSLKLGVLYQCTLIERGKVTLIYAHLAPYLVARSYKTVAETIVDAVGTDIDRERLVCMPTVFISCRNGNTK